MIFPWTGGDTVPPYILVWLMGAHTLQNMPIAVAVAEVAGVASAAVAAVQAQSLAAAER